MKGTPFSLLVTPSFVLIAGYGLTMFVFLPMVGLFALGFRILT